jgi:lipopolysaccharide transport system ATP-binding protein
MRTSIIDIAGLGKRYRIGASREKYLSLRDEVARKAHGLYRRFVARHRHLPAGEDFWALKDVSFSVQEGDVVGIIGRNGAGKSTLLKILSQITPPTEGSITLRGRVASLLEVGTGFHQELTGRENIFLNGAILGMTRAEIRRKFDEIVAFAEVEKFLDTPVKRYSSGMYVRLAFGVAAHLDPEILVIDEVLAVGDALFQKKCLGKMSEVAAGGRTILFVSHSMPMIASLCTRCVLLSGGAVKAMGPPGEVIAAYQSDGRESPASVDYTNSRHAPGDQCASLVAAWLEDLDAKTKADFSITEPIFIAMKYKVLAHAARQPFPNFHIHDSAGQYVFVSAPDGFPSERDCAPGEYLAKCEIPGHFLNDGLFSVDVALTFKATHVSFHEKHALTFNVTDPMTAATRKLDYHGRIPGVVRPILKWTLERIS